MTIATGGNSGGGANGMTDAMTAPGFNVEGESRNGTKGASGKINHS
jgi:hypothetical protein